eukprot:CAMPEP_0202453418 /NCGR_PEP_ID=MMETSP1360-20130828/11396_1 /ASSEMBLY_ACC=CAM_ASM_000848 /TAXON_ID=515479 /ORGANISM="Licmophora paradoxa, Strain CCMP2313" /LENGTH=182 /DNA_ID=CAMNT_0049072501 /DNA_START=13 /DNA_END=561 /DNA_ORIENTATION=-
MTVMKTQPLLIGLCSALLLHFTHSWVIHSPKLQGRSTIPLFMAVADFDFDFDALLDMDVVLFRRVMGQEDGGDEKGNTMELGAMQEDGTVAPLSAWSEDAAFGTSIEFVVDEEDRFPGLEKDDIEIIKVLGEDVISYGSRQVGGGKGPGNPHGEESELLYYIEKGELNEIEFMVKPELEILW